MIAQEPVYDGDDPELLASLTTSQSRVGCSSTAARRTPSCSDGIHTVPRVDMAAAIGAAEATGSKLVMVGDSEQLPGIGAAGMFRHLVATAAAAASRTGRTPTPGRFETAATTASTPLQSTAASLPPATSAEPQGT